MHVQMVDRIERRHMEPKSIITMLVDFAKKCVCDIIQLLPHLRAIVWIESLLSEELFAQDDHFLYYIQTMSDACFDL